MSGPGPVEEPVHEPPPDADGRLYEVCCLAALSHALFEYEDPSHWKDTREEIRAVELVGPYPETSVRVRWWAQAAERTRSNSHPLWRDGTPFWADRPDPATEVATRMMCEFDERWRNLSRRRRPLTITAPISEDLLGDRRVYEMTCLAATCDALFDYQGVGYWVKDGKDIRAVELLERYPDTQLRVRWYDRWTSKEKQLRDFLWKDGEPPPGAPDPITEIALSFMDEVAES